ncbi:flavin reductase family protein [Rhodococcus sp. 2H158]
MTTAVRRGASASRTSVSNIDASALRRTLGHVPTSVAVVTAMQEDGPVGMSVGSMTSVSLDPPLVVFFGITSSYTFSQLQRTQRFCINVLAEDQHDICYAFASRTGARFEVGHWENEDESEAPRLLGATAWIDCTTESVFEAGDHLGMMGRIHSATHTDNRPLLFHRGRLTRLHQTAGRTTSTTRLDWWTA